MINIKLNLVISNLRTSEIPMYFKTLRSKSIVDKTNLNSNAPSTDIENNNVIFYL